MEGMKVFENIEDERIGVYLSEQMEEMTADEIGRNVKETLRKCSDDARLKYCANNVLIGLTGYGIHSLLEEVDKMHLENETERLNLVGDDKEDLEKVTDEELGYVVLYNGVWDERNTFKDVGSYMKYAEERIQNDEEYRIFDEMLQSAAGVSMKRAAKELGAVKNDLEAKIGSAMGKVELSGPEGKEVPMAGSQTR